MSAAWYVNVLNNFVTPDMPQFGNWRVAAMPAFAKGGVRASNLGGSELAIATQTPDDQQKLAMAFIKFVCASLEGAKAHADYGEFPAFLPAYPTDIVQNKTFPVLGDQKVYKLFAQITPHGPGDLEDPAPVHADPVHPPGKDERHPHRQGDGGEGTAAGTGGSHEASK